MELGIDISSYLEEEKLGAKFYDSKKEVNPIDEFYLNGVRYSRIRLWHNPYSLDNKPYLGGTCDLNNFLKLAKLMISKGYRIILDIHYSDFWADPHKQVPPKAFRGLPFKKLKEAVYEYTKNTLKTINDNGITLDYIQIGNEITNGMLWPYGKLEEDEESWGRRGYDYLSDLLKEGIKATREICPNTGIILHLEKSYDSDIYDEFFSNMEKFGVDYDYIGMSYYPYWHHTIKDLFNNVEFCKNKFKKEIMIVELGYGFTLDDYVDSSDVQGLVVNKYNLDTFDMTLEYPITKDGQAAFIKDFLNEARKHDIKLVIYWEPTLIPCEGSSWASVEGQEYIKEKKAYSRNEWANQCLFDYNGEKTPAFFEFKTK